MAYTKPKITLVGVQTLYAEGGMPRFFKGLAPLPHARRAPPNAAMLYTVDKIGALLD